MNKNKFYWTDLSISVLEIEADSREQAEKVVQELINRFANSTENFPKIRWDNVDWEIKESVLNQETGVWVDTVPPDHCHCSNCNCDIALEEGSRVCESCVSQCGVSDE